MTLEKRIRFRYEVQVFLHQKLWVDIKATTSGRAQWIAYLFRRAFPVRHIKIVRIDHPATVSCLTLAKFYDGKTLKYAMYFQNSAWVDLVAKHWSGRVEYVDLHARWAEENYPKSPKVKKAGRSFK